MVRRSSRLSSSAEIQKDECKEKEEIEEGVEKVIPAKRKKTTQTKSALKKESKKRKPEKNTERRAGKRIKSGSVARAVTPPSESSEEVTDQLKTTPKRKAKTKAKTKAKNLKKVEEDFEEDEEEPDVDSEASEYKCKSSEDEKDDESLGSLVLEDEDEEEEKQLKMNKSRRKTVKSKSKTKALKTNNTEFKTANEVIIIQSNDENTANNAPQPDGNGGLTQPNTYKASYAATGRATCRGCDKQIAKGSLRITHRPLFRGKPGYEVHRHLQCIVFSEVIQNAEDVGGYHKLKDEDLALLAQRVEESKIEIKAEMEEAHPDELVPVSFQGPIIDSPSDLTASLLPFQVEGVSWMNYQEISSDTKGGILADEMGMGKTLQTITTILANKPKLQHSLPNAKYPPDLREELYTQYQKEDSMWDKVKDQWEFELKMNEVPADIFKSKGKNTPSFPLRAGTLVICPVIAIYQWKAEIEKFTTNALKIGVYHGPNRQSDNTPQTLAKYDIVLTTYNVIESDFRKMVSLLHKVCCPNCGKKYRLDKLKVHLKYFCGDGAQRTEAQMRQRRGNNHRENNNDSEDDDSYHEDDDSKPKMTKGKGAKKNKKADTNMKKKQDEKDVNKKKNTKKAKKKNSQNKKKSKHFDDDYDNSDFDEDSNESDEDDFDLKVDKILEKFKKQTKKHEISYLHSLTWWRVVLDEAHYIKSRQSQTSAAVFALSSIHRWCLSGTPLQNRVGEFYSLIRFLRIDPMAHYCCKVDGCDCKSLHYRLRAGKCLDCNHGAISHYSYFNRYILNPIQRDGYCGEGRRAMFKLKDEVLDKSLLRRTKETRAEDMNLPPRIVSIKYVKLHPIEEDFYNALYTQTRSSFDEYVQDGTLMNNYAHIFDLLVKMRMAVNHPYMVVYGKKNIMRNNTNSLFNNSSQAINNNNQNEIINGTNTCELCAEYPESGRLISSCCESSFCKTCVIDYMDLRVATNNSGEDGVPCPVCRRPFSIDLNNIIPSNNSPQEEVVNESRTINRNIKKTVSMDEKLETSNLIPALKVLPHLPSTSILRRINLAEFTTSTKIEALVFELAQMRRSSPASKAIIFSQFVNMLDLIRWRLSIDPYVQDVLGLKCVQIHGGMTVQNRNKYLKQFKEDPDTRVLLISLKAGGVALNLTVANYIFLMDPWWNPASEYQAIDRTHRLGQYRPIKAIRFIAENTVEERILQLQEKKRLVFDGTVGRDATSLAMLTSDDMKSLFQ